MRRKMYEMIQEQQTKLAEIKATIAKLQSQVAEIETSKFTYPMWFREIAYPDVVVKFTALTTGEVISSMNKSDIGTVAKYFTPHTNTSIWEQVPEPKPQWEPKGGEWAIRDSGEVLQITSDEMCTQFGTEYQTKKQAEWARDYMRRFNRLLAYVAEFDVDENGVQWQPSFDNNKFDCCYIAFDSQKQSWSYYSSKEVQVMSVYMSEKCAKELIEKLNSGEVVL